MLSGLLMADTSLARIQQECGYGMSPQAKTRSPIAMVGILLRGRLTASALLLAVRVLPSMSGMQRIEGISTSIAVIQTLILLVIQLYMQWHGHLMASASPQGVVIRPSRCGMRRMEVMSTPIGGIAVRYRSEEHT